MTTVALIPHCLGHYLVDAPSAPQLSKKSIAPASSFNGLLRFYHNEPLRSWRNKWSLPYSTRLNPDDQILKRVAIAASTQILQATPNVGNSAGAVRFTIYEHHLLHGNDLAIIYFPKAMQDEGEHMFLLMAILQTEMHCQDQLQGTRNAGVIVTAGA
ncbi:hypothetical protein B0H17DRAFT_1127245 [Mycena rosella]|uniref:Uncharacterized protein n=1 Tax=Mycena rosella TaxID=1033263 RepID=A0AAD7E292_MYCRO|nr:hypothetical protein B0H17DRAFT_1127245 [Mycena rosella]